MKSLILTIMILIAMFAGGCQSIQSKAKEKVKDKIETVVVKKFESGEMSYAEYKVTEQITYMIIPLCVAVFAGGVLIFAGRIKIGLGLIVASISTIVLMFFLAVHLALLSWIGGVIIVIASYYLIKHQIAQNRFQLDAVKSVDRIKELVPVEHKEKLKVRLDKLQSNTTKSIVKKLKKAIKK